MGFFRKKRCVSCRFAPEPQYGSGLRPKRSHKVGPEESGNELADNEVGVDLAIQQVTSIGFEDPPSMSK